MITKKLLSYLCFCCIMLLLTGIFDLYNIGCSKITRTRCTWRNLQVKVKNCEFSWSNLSYICMSTYMTQHFHLACIEQLSLHLWLAMFLTNVVPMEIELSGLRKNREIIRWWTTWYIQHQAQTCLRSVDSDINVFIST